MSLLRRPSMRYASAGVLTLSLSTASTRKFLNSRWTHGDDGLTLPGTPFFYSYQNRSHDVEINDNLTHEQGRHVVKFGGGVLLRHLDGYLTTGRDGFFFFDSTQCFLADKPILFDIAQTRSQPQSNAIPQYDRTYRYNQFFAFAQDSFKVAPRLVLNYGLRYDNLGVPYNIGPVKDALISLGNGSSFPQRIASATLSPPNTLRDEKLYDPDNRDFSFRAGFAYGLFGNMRTALRGGYGIYYDPPFDNLWQTLSNNNVVLAAPGKCSNSVATGCFTGPINFLQPVATIAAHIPNLQASDNTSFPQPTFFQPGLRNGYAQNFFVGVQQQFTESFGLQVNGLGSLDRELLTTDVVNRDYSLPGAFQNPSGYLNPGLQTPLSYRANQGFSDYYALTIVGRYRRPHSLLQASYTWSKVIDNQSDPLLNDFFDLNITSMSSSPGTNSLPAFREQFNSNGDRGLADFDQRQNLVVLGIEELPSVLQSTALAPVFRKWKIAALAAVRSGFPYSVIVPTTDGQDEFVGGGTLYNNLANLVEPSAVHTSAAVRGGILLLNPNAFSQPGAGQSGNTGRNAFTGPGLYSIDASLSRTFALRRLSEAGRLVVRADAFNVLNHANLNNPSNFFSSGNPDFGIATFGRQEAQSGFPAVTPFNETARQIQILMRLDF